MRFIRFYRAASFGFLLVLPAYRAVQLPTGNFTSHTNGQTVTSPSISITWKGCSNATQTTYTTRVNGVARTTTQSSASACPDYTIGKNYAASGTLNTGANSLYLNVCDVSGCGSKTITVYYYAPGISVTPDGATAPSVPHRTSSSYAFTVQNSGGLTATASFTASCTGSLGSCSVAPASASLTPGGSTSATVSYTGATVGNGQATLTATYSQYPTTTDNGYVNVNVTENPIWGVTVVPVNASQTVSAGSAVIPFDVANTSQYTSTASTFALTPAVAGSVSSCTLSPASVTLSPGAPSTRVDATCAISSSGTSGSVTVTASTASPASFSANGTTNVTITPTYGVAVTPDGQGVSVDQNTSQSGSFTVTNTGNVSNTFTISSSCSGTVTSCAPSPASLTVAAQASAAVTLAYQAGSGGSTGTAGITAVSGAVSDGGSYAVSVISGVGIELDSANSLEVVARDECVTVSLGSGAASECGDLRLVHSLPAVRTLNKERAPVLLYDSQHALPRPVIAADLTVPSTATLPDSIRGKISIGGTDYAASTWSGSAWGSPGVTRRVALSFDGSALATGVYPFTFTAVRYSPSQTVTSTASGKVIIVNRGSSAFGAGWWMSGWEQLYFPTDTTTRLWVAGDGSARVYRKAHDSVYVATALDRPDSLAWSAGNSRYIRWGTNKLQVRFDASGVHRETINRLGHTTVFAGSATQLDSIGVPTATSAKLWYRFTYSSGKLTGISAPGPSGARALVVTQSSGRITQIAGPDTTQVGFGYSGATARVISRTDRALNTAKYGYDAVGRISADTLTPGGGASLIVTRFRPAESQLALAGVPMIADSVYTIIAGPRNDSTRLRINRYGAPVRVENALGQVTTLARANATYPSLVTSMTAPNALVTQATYDTRGHVATVTVVSPYGGSNAVTTHWWNPVWDMPDSTRTPTGVVLHFEYDGKGSRLSEQVGSSSAKRVSFGFDATNGLVRTITTPASATPDSVFYDGTLANVSMTRSPLGVKSVSVADAIGRDTLSYMLNDPLNARTATYYDVMDRVIRTVSKGDGGTRPALVGVPGSAPADSLVVTNLYDRAGRLLRNDRTLGVNLLGFGGPFNTYSYDGIGRTLIETSPSRATSYAYDAGGNVTSTTIGAQTVTMQYDLLNRLVKRITPTRTFDAVGCASLPNVPPDCYAGGQWKLPAPAFITANSYNKDVCIPADTAEFQYDVAGNMIRADNGDARVRRGYYANGQVRADTVSIRRLYRAVANECGGVAPPPPDSVAMCGDEAHGYHPCEEAIALPGAGNLRVGALDSPKHIFGDATVLPEAGVRLALGDVQSTFDFGIALERAFRSYATSYATSAVGDDADFQTYVYALGYTYNLDGTRATMTHPSSLAGSSSPQTYTYNTGTAASTGELTDITDPRGLPYHFVYDNAGRLTTFTAFASPNSASEVLGYDDESHLTSRQVTASSVSSTDGMTYDMNGRLSYAAHTHSDGYINANYTQSTYYNGLGAVVGTEVEGTGGSSSEAFTVDALGDRIKSWGRTDDTNPDDPSHERSLSFTTGLGLSQIVSPKNGLLEGVYYKENKSYDLAGNETLTGSAERANSNSEMSFVQRVSFYDATEKLRVTERHLGAYAQLNANTPTDFGAYEEYRYDALGRRVFLVSRGNGGSYTERTIWDNDQMLYQVRDPYPNATAGNGGVMGTVGYVHGGGLDHPLAVWSSEGTVAPFADWRGVYALGSNSNGQACCSTFLWPARGMTVDHLTKKETGLWLWMGSLLEEGSDKSGLQYKRNRYFDPTTGRFTQEDPIGLAGGLNAYGFAGGDPINFSDPFGLWPCPELCAAGGVGALSAGSAVLEGVSLATIAPFVAPIAVAAVVAGAVYYGQHARAASRTGASIAIANEHIEAAGAPPPGGEDPNWMNDKLKHAQKHINNARKYVKDVLGKTRRELERQIENAQREIDALRRPATKSVAPE